MELYVIYRTKDSGKVITATINLHVYIQIQGILTTTIEYWFGDYEVIFQDNNISCRRAKEVKVKKNQWHDLWRVWI